MLHGLPGQQGTSSAVRVKPPDVTSSWPPALGRTLSWGSWLWTEGEALQLGGPALVQPGPLATSLTGSLGVGRRLPARTIREKTVTPGGTARVLRGGLGGGSKPLPRLGCWCLPQAPRVSQAVAGPRELAGS